MEIKAKLSKKNKVYILTRLSIAAVVWHSLLAGEIGEFFKVKKCT